MVKLADPPPTSAEGKNSHSYIPTSFVLLASVVLN
jgi:hypothetical protein